MDWTDERIETLKTLYGDGLSASQIGAELGCTRNAVIGKVHRIGLRRRGRPVAVSRPQPRHKPQRRAPIKQGAIVRAPQQPYVEPTPIEDSAIPTAQHCSLLELTSKTCRWPIGDPGKPDFFFCGGPADNNLGLPYCSYHSRAAYQPATVRRAPKYEYAYGLKKAG